MLNFCDINIFAGTGSQKIGSERVNDGHDELYHHAKFAEDRTTRAGCRCENVVFVFFCFFLFVGHAPRLLLTYVGGPKSYENAGRSPPWNGVFDRRTTLLYQARSQDCQNEEARMSSVPPILTFVARRRHNFR